MSHTVTGSVKVWEEPTVFARFVQFITHGTIAQYEPDAVTITGGTVTGTAAAKSIEADVAAAGSVQGDATLLDGSDVTTVTTIAAGAGVILPVAVAGQIRFIYNNHASEALDIYPDTGGVIDAGSANDPLVIAANVGVTLHAVTSTLWLSDA